MSAIEEVTGHVLYYLLLVGSSGIICVCCVVF